MVKTLLNPLTNRQIQTTLDNARHISSSLMKDEIPHEWQKIIHSFEKLGHAFTYTTDDASFSRLPTDTYPDIVKKMDVLTRINLRKSGKVGNDAAPQSWVNKEATKFANWLTKNIKYFYHDDEWSFEEHMQFTWKDKDENVILLEILWDKRLPIIRPRIHVEYLGESYKLIALVDGYKAINMSRRGIVYVLGALRFFGETLGPKLGVQTSELTRALQALRGSVENIGLPIIFNEANVTILNKIYKKTTYLYTPLPNKSITLWKASTRSKWLYYIESSDDKAVKVWISNMNVTFPDKTSFTKIIKGDVSVYKGSKLRQ